MVTREIEETVEKTDYETVTEEVVWCDGCMAECTDDHVTLTNISTDCVEKMVNESDTPAGVAAVDTTVVENVIDNAEQFHFCPDCQAGIRAHERTISTELYEYDEEADTSQSEEPAPHPKAKRFLFWCGVFFAFGVFGQTTAGGALVLVVLSIASFWLSKTTIDDPQRPDERLW